MGVGASKVSGKDLRALLSPGKVSGKNRDRCETGRCIKIQKKDLQALPRESAPATCKGNCCKPCRGRGGARKTRRQNSRRYCNRVPGGPVPVPVPALLPMVWFWWPGGPVPVLVPVPAPVPVPVSFGGPVPVLGPARSRWPGPSPNKADHLCSVASFKQSLPGKWWFYPVLQTTGGRQTILRSRNHYRTKTGAKRLPKPTA